MAAPSYLRQMSIFDPGEHGAVPIAIVGAGMIGSPTALALAKLGCSNITVYDGDTVCAHNLPNQMFSADSLDSGESQNKAILLQREVLHWTGTEIKAIPMFWDASMPLGPGIVVSAVDSLDMRKKIWECIKYDISIPFFVDGRIGGETEVVYSVDKSNPSDCDFYAGSLLGTPEELPCTSRGVIDMSFMMAGFVTRAIRTWIVQRRRARWVSYAATVPAMYVQEGD